MKFSKKTKYAMLGLLVILNLVLRLPVTPHELGADSFMVHAWANSISSNGYAKWIVHPLSFFGLYPFSYSSGELFLLSDISQCTGVEMEWAIWIAATFFGVLGAFTSYLMAKEIMNDFLFAFSVAFVYSTARMFIAFTTWTVSTRGLFVALLPLLIWSLLRSYNQKEERLKYLLLAVGLLIILGTIHQLIFFTPLILIAFGVSILFYYIADKKSNTLKITPKVGVILFFALFIPLLLLPFTPLGFYHDVEAFEAGHKSGYFFHGPTSYNILLNMGAEYAMAVGILIALVPIGLILLLLKKQKTLSEMFLIALLLCFAPFFADPIYMRFFVLFIFSLLIGFGLLGIIKMLGNVRKVKSIAPLIIISILIFSALLPYFVVVRPVPSLPMHTEYMNELTYNSALFIKTHGVEIPRVSNAKHILGRIDAIAGPPYYHEDIDELNRWIEPISLLEFFRGKGEYDYLYKINKRWYDYLNWMWDCDNDRTKRVLDNKNHLVIEDNYLPKLPFYRSLHETRPKIYDNGLESIWYLNY